MAFFYLVDDMYLSVFSESYLENKIAFFTPLGVTVTRLKRAFATSSQSALSRFCFALNESINRIALDVIVTDDAGIDITMSMRFKEEPATSAGGYGSTNRDIYIYQDRYYYAKISEEYYQQTEISATPYYEGQVSSFYRTNNPFDLGKLMYLEDASRFVQIIEPRNTRRFNLFRMNNLSYDEAWNNEEFYINILSGRSYIQEMQLLTYFEQES